jgi:hypothetical protein
LDRVGNTWVDADTDERPYEDCDSRTCDSIAWREMPERLDTDAVMYLGAEMEQSLGRPEIHYLYTILYVASRLVHNCVT